MTPSRLGQLGVAVLLVAAACTSTPTGTDPAPSSPPTASTPPSPETTPPIPATPTTSEPAPTVTAPEGSNLVVLEGAVASLAIPTEWQVVDSVGGALPEDVLEDLTGTLGPANRPLVALVEAVRDHSDDRFLFLAFVPTSERYAENLTVTFTEVPTTATRLGESTADLVVQAGGEVTGQDTATKDGFPTSTVRYSLSIETADGTVEVFGISHSIVLGDGYLTITLSSGSLENLAEIEARIIPTIHLVVG